MLWGKASTTPFKLVFHGWIYEERTLHVAMVCGLFGFIFSDNENCATGFILRDHLAINALLSIVVKMEIIQ